MWLNALCKLTLFVVFALLALDGGFLCDLFTLQLRALVVFLHPVFLLDTQQSIRAFVLTELVGNGEVGQLVDLLVVDEAVLVCKVADGGPLGHDATNVIVDGVVVDHRH